MTRKEYKDDLQQKLNQLRNDIQNYFYYLEEEDLNMKPHDKAWSILEIFKHLNLVHQFYLQQMERKVPQLKAPDSDQLAPGWLGRTAVKNMEPGNNGSIPFKMKTFKKIDPIQARARGEAIVADVVFRDFVEDLQRLEDLIQQAENKSLENAKIQTVLPLLKMRISDALPFILAHAQRHVVQAKGNLES